MSAALSCHTMWQLSAADEARTLTSNNLYNFLSNVLTNYDKILQNTPDFVILIT